LERHLVEHSDWVIAIAFLIGAFFSAFAGWIGMSIATKANVRTTQAARTSLAQGFEGELQRGHRDGPRRGGSGRGRPQHLFIVFLACT
jgi:K(+)-stimulated pyrophosphate-energized sodium pump